MNHIRINDATFYEDNDRCTVWEANADLDRPGGGSDEGRVLVALDVDGQMDIVYASDLCTGGDLSAIDRAIGALERVKNGLGALYAGRNDPGTCWEQGDTGRCYGQLDHDGDHEFPSQEQMRAILAIRTGKTPTAIAS